MKIILFYVILIGMLINMNSCEKADIHKAATSDQVQILPRGECEECPDNDECCCYLLLYPGYNNVAIRLCGTADGSLTCTGNPPDPCDDFSDGGQTAFLQISDPKHEFCMDKNSPFSVTNTTGSAVSFYIVCWDQLSSIDQVVVGLGVGETEYFFTDGNCDVEPCE